MCPWLPPGRGSAALRRPALPSKRPYIRRRAVGQSTRAAAITPRTRNAYVLVTHEPFPDAEDILYFLYGPDDTRITIDVDAGR